jgi:hypothetical protein
MKPGWKIVGSTVLAAMAVTLAMNFKSIRRYIRMSMM